MKIILLYLTSVFFTLLCSAQTVPVTFHFDARNSAFKVINFLGGDTLRDDDGDGFFELTLDLSPGNFDYLYWMNNALDVDPHNPVLRNGNDGSTMLISDPMVSYLLPKDGDMMRENRIRADFAYTPQNPPLSGSIKLTVNGKSIDNAGNYYNSQKRILQIDQPSYLIEGENTVTVSYQTNKGKISRTSTFTYHSAKLMVDERIYRMKQILAWGRVLVQPYPASVFVKCEGKVYEAPVNSMGYFGVEVEIQNGENSISVASTENGLSNPVDKITCKAELHHDWWVELTGSVNGDNATIQAIPHDIESGLTYEWKEAGDNPSSLGISGSSANLSFKLPNEEGEYKIELHVTSTDGTDYTARKILVNNNYPHFLGLHEKAAWMETAVQQEIESTYFYIWNTYSFEKLAKVIPHFKECGINLIAIPPFNKGGYIAADHYGFDDEDGLKELVKTAHKYGIKVALDFAFGHAAPQHYFMNVNYKLPGQAMPYDQFNIWKGEPGASEYEVSEQGYNVVHLNLETEFTQQYIIKLAEYWLEKFDVDGYRFDSGQEAVNRSPGFQTTMLKRIKNIKPDAWILTEGDDRDNLSKPNFSYYDFGDAVYDWGLNVEWGGGPYGFPGVFKGIYSPDQFHELVLTGIPPDSGLALRYANVDYFDYLHNRYGWEQERTALSIVFSTYGMPSLFQGEELGCTKALGTFDFTDPLGIMPFYQRLISMRKQLLGNFPKIERLSVSNSNEIYAFTSWRDTSMVLTVSNFTSTPKQVQINMADAAFKGKQIKRWSEITDQEEKTFSNETATSISLAGWESKVYALNVGLQELFPSVKSIDLFSVDGKYEINENGATLGFEAIKTPSNSLDAIEWFAESNKHLATVDNGILTPCGCGSGDVTVIARSKNNPSIEARKTVAISNQTSGELLNANFNNGVNEWFLEWSNCNITAQGDNGEALITFDETQIDDCRPHFSNMAYLYLENEKNYKVGFTTHSSSPKRVYCAVQDINSGQVVCWSEFDVDQKNQQYYTAFKMNEATTNNAQFYFLFAGSNDSLWLDNVSLCESKTENVKVNITFQLDMQNEEVSPNGIFINGSFNNWAEAIQLNNIGGSIYATTIDFNAQDLFDYKFINGNPSGDWQQVVYEDLKGNCANEWGNRVFQVAYTDTILDPICFNSCSACIPPIVSDSVKVTFQVDMKNEAVTSAGVYLNGSFCNWTPADAPKMQLTSGGLVYATTLQLKKGETIEYKFVNGAADDWAKYEIIAGQACAYGNDGNRMLVVPNTDVTLDMICFESCSACVPPIVSDSVKVTFQVDMKNEAVTSAGVYLNGSFCDWAPANALKLTEFMTAEYSFYGITLTLPIGETIEYKFVNGAPDQWTKYEILNGLPCAYGNDANRGLLVPENDLVLDVVCFESCEACKNEIDIYRLAKNLETYPNPVSDFITITGLSNKQCYRIELTNISGKQILVNDVSNCDKSIINLSSYPKGNYQLSVWSSALLKTIKIVKQ